MVIGSWERQMDSVKKFAEAVLEVLTRNQKAVDGWDWLLCHRISTAISLEYLEHIKH
jgi:hypothetical protein